MDSAKPRLRLHRVPVLRRNRVRVQPVQVLLNWEAPARPEGWVVRSALVDG